jgi:hypothetical protein
MVPLHAAVSQVTGAGGGQAWVLQDWFSVNDGQLVPPLAACFVTLLDLVCLPPPHVLSQALQDDHPLTSQFTGGGGVGADEGKRFG